MVVRRWRLRSHDSPRNPSQSLKHLALVIPRRIIYLTFHQRLSPIIPHSSRALSPAAFNIKSKSWAFVPLFFDILTALGLRRNVLLQISLPSTRLLPTAALHVSLQNVDWSIKLFLIFSVVLLASARDSSSAVAPRNLCRRNSGTRNWRQKPQPSSRQIPNLIRREPTRL